jgi:hypothetical protein
MTPAKVCAVCSRPLNLFTPTGSWIHADRRDDDHPPVPVDPADIPPTLHCDFCYAEPAVGRLPVTPIELAPGHLSDPGWAVCAPCKRLIARGRWPQLIHRAARAAATHLTQMSGDGAARPHAPASLAAITAQLTAMYAQVQAHITGPIGPL